jgi:nitroreductase
MDFQDVVRRRRMVRNYEDRPVPPEIRDRILANAVHAPSAGFSQGWAFLVLEDAADRDRFWSLTLDPDEAPDNWLESMRRAPLLIASLSHKAAYIDRYAEADKGWTDRDEARWPVPYWHIDTGFATLLMLLTVVDAGLGACFFGVQPEQIPAFRAEFGVPEEYTPIGVTSIGYRAADRKSPSLRRGRREVDDVVHHGNW